MIEYTAVPNDTGRRCFLLHRWSMWEKKRESAGWGFGPGWTVQERRCVRCGRYQRAAL